MGITVIGGGSAAGAGSVLGTTTFKNPKNYTFVNVGSYVEDANPDVNVRNYYGVAITKTGDMIGVTYGPSVYYWEYQNTGIPFGSSYTGTEQAFLNRTTPNDASPQFTAVAVHPQGTHLYLLNVDAVNEIVVVPFGTAGEPSTLNFAATTSYRFGTELGITTPGDTGIYNGTVLVFNGDGTKLYLNSGTTNVLYELTLSTGYDPSTVSSVTTVNHVGLFATAIVPDKIEFSSDGNYFAICDASQSHVSVYTCDTPYSLTNFSRVSLTSGIQPYFINWSLDNVYLFSQRGDNRSATYYNTNYTVLNNLSVTAELDLSTGNRFIVSNPEGYQEYSIDLINPPASGTLKEAEITFHAPAKSISAATAASLTRGSFSVSELYNYSSVFRLTSPIAPLSDGMFAVVSYDSTRSITLFKPRDWKKGRDNNRTASTYKAGSWQVLDPSMDYYEIYARSMPTTLNTSAYLSGFSSSGESVYYQDPTTNELIQFRFSMAQSYLAANPTKPYAKISVNSSRVWKISNDGLYLYGAAGANIVNYKLNIPWDVSSVSATQHSIGAFTTDIVPSLFGVGFNGSLLVGQNSVANKLAYYNMTIPHDLSTLSAEYLSEDTQTYATTYGFNISHDNSYIMRATGNSTSYRPYYLLLPTERDIIFNQTVSIDPQDASFHVGETKTIKLATVDGGSNYLTY